MKMAALARADVPAFEGYSRLKIQSAIFLLALCAGPLKAPLAPAQALPARAPAATVMVVSGTATVTRSGQPAVPLKLGDAVYMGDVISTGDKSTAYLLFTDNTIQLRLAADTELSIDEYAYSPNANWHNKIRYKFLKGAFEYLNGIVGKPEELDVQIDTPLGTIVDRGTYFICEYDAPTKTLGVYLSIGAVDFTPAGGAARPATPDPGAAEGMSPAGGGRKLPMSGPGPAWVKIGPSGTWVLAFTQDQYAYLEAQLSLAQRVVIPASAAQAMDCSKINTTPLAIAFISYTTEVSSQQLLADYQALYNAGLDGTKNCQADSDSFADRMNRVAAKRVAVSFIVVDATVKSPENFAAFGPISQAAYANGKKVDPNIIAPNPEEIAMTIEVTNAEYEVVLSQQALMNAIYYSDAKTDNSGVARTSTTAPLPEPIQIPMAYELGSNVFNMTVQPPNMCEGMAQSDTNRFILAAYKNFAPNRSKDESAVGSYGDLPGQTFYAPHGYFDLQLPKQLGAKNPQPLAPPQNAYVSTSGKQEAPVPIYIGYGIKPAQCTPASGKTVPAQAAPLQ
jgi:hypothetical protein